MGMVDMEKKQRQERGLLSRENIRTVIRLGGKRGQRKSKINFRFCSQSVCTEAYPI